MLAEQCVRHGTVVNIVNCLFGNKLMKDEASTRVSYHIKELKRFCCFWYTGRYSNIYHISRHYDVWDCTGIKVLHMFHNI
jgi:hypothetical protein